jgi:N4-gp56 family major capsid protein
MATNLLISPEIQTTYNRALLHRFRAKTLFTKFGDQQSIPKGGGVAMSFRRMETIRPVVTASTSSWPADATYTSAVGAVLTEGTFLTPTIVASWANVVATIRQYGQAAYISDLVDAQQIDAAVPEYVKNFGEAMAELLDLVTRDLLLTTGNIQYANAKASQSLVISGDNMTLVEIRKGVRTVKRANVSPVLDGRFALLVHPDTVFDLQGDTNITNVWTYGGAGKRQEDIFDATPTDLPFGVRVYESTLLPITRASGYGDVYNSFLLGEGGYGTVKCAALPSRVIVHPPGSSGALDPLDQVGTVGWKANYAAALLNSDAVLRIEHQASAFTGTRAGI